MDEVLHQMVKDSFTTGDFEVKPLFQKLRSKEDERARDVTKRTTLRVREDSFGIGLLWKHSAVTLPESYLNAFNWLKCQERKMDKKKDKSRVRCSWLWKVERIFGEELLQEIRSGGNSHFITMIMVFATLRRSSSQ